MNVILKFTLTPELMHVIGDLLALGHDKGVKGQTFVEGQEGALVVEDARELIRDAIDNGTTQTLTMLNQLRGELSSLSDIVLEAQTTAEPVTEGKQELIDLIPTTLPVVGVESAPDPVKPVPQLSKGEQRERSGGTPKKKKKPVEKIYTGEAFQTDQTTGEVLAVRCSQDGRVYLNTVGMGSLLRSATGIHTDPTIMQKWFNKSDFTVLIRPDGRSRRRMYVDPAVFLPWIIKSGCYINAISSLRDHIEDGHRLDIPHLLVMWSADLNGDPISPTGKPSTSKPRIPKNLTNNSTPKDVVKVVKAIGGEADKNDKNWKIKVGSYEFTLSTTANNCPRQHVRRLNAALDKLRA